MSELQLKNSLTPIHMDIQLSTLGLCPYFNNVVGEGKCVATLANGRIASH